MSSTDISEHKQEPPDTLIKPSKLQVPATAPPNSSVIIKKRRPTNIERLRTVRSSSCPSIVNFLENKRKREPEDSHFRDSEARPVKILSSVSPTPRIVISSVDPDMDKILLEIKALRVAQDSNHKELTDKIEQNSTVFTNACKTISASLDKFKEEYQQSKAVLESRISALETNSVKISQIHHLQELSTALESQAKTLETGGAAAIHKKLEDMDQRLEYLEKERKKNNIAIMGLTLPASAQATCVQNFLKDKFNVDCNPDSIRILSKRVIVDLKSYEIKAKVMRSKKGALAGTNIYVEPDRTSKESLEDWHLRSAKKQLEKEGKKVTRKRNTIIVDDTTYRWSSIDNKLVTRDNNNNSKKHPGNNVPMDTISPQKEKN